MQTKASLPRHLAVIMDGNGRWAKQRGLSRSEGHRAGVKAAEKLVTACRKLEIPHLTLYTFSQENWGRPEAEVRLIFQLLVDFLGAKISDMVSNSIRFTIFGELDALPLAARTSIRHAVKQTAKGSALTVNLALNYSGREEVLRATRSLLEQKQDPQGLTEEVFRQHLYSAGQPDPDFIIRTSGECRLSNFLIFQSAYSELYFPNVLWPDFSENHLHEALANFAQRSRRFGLTEEQVNHE